MKKFNPKSSHKNHQALAKAIDELPKRNLTLINCESEGVRIIRANIKSYDKLQGRIAFERKQQILQR